MNTLPADVSTYLPAKGDRIRATVEGLVGRSDYVGFNLTTDSNVCTAFISLAAEPVVELLEAAPPPPASPPLVIPEQLGAVVETAEGLYVYAPSCNNPGHPWRQAKAGSAVWTSTVSVQAKAVKVLSEGVSS